MISLNADTWLMVEILLFMKFSLGTHCWVIIYEILIDPAF